MSNDEVSPDGPKPDAVSTPRSATATATAADLAGLVIVVAGAAGAAGPPLVERLARAGATVVAIDANRERLEEVVAAARAASGSGQVEGHLVDLLDEPATMAFAAQVLARHAHVDGLVHLVGGWRGGKSIVESDLADWDWLHAMLIRTLQHTSRAFHDALKASPRGRLVLISTVEAQAPSATNAAYAAAKAAAETWTLAVADSFGDMRGGDTRDGGTMDGDTRDGDSGAAAVILQVKALLTPAMREAKPEATFSGYTPVGELADTIHDLWLAPANELNGKRLRGGSR